MKKKTIEDLLVEYNVNEEYLKDAYSIRKLSLPLIKAERGIPFRAICRLLDHFNIPIRSISDSRKTAEFKDSLQSSLRKKYGNNITNVSQLDSVKKKKESSCLLKYGVTNIRKSKEYYKWLDGFMIEKYGTKRTGFVCWNTERRSKKTKEQWNKLPTHEREEKIKTILKTLHSSSPSLKNNLEACVASVLDTIQLSYERRFSVGNYYCDFFIPSFNLIIEANGDFWHANPLKYSKTDILNWPGNSVVAESIWKKDNKKIEFLKNRNYNVLILWESDKNLFQTIVEEFIKNIGKTT